MADIVADNLTVNGRLGVGTASPGSEVQIDGIGPVLRIWNTNDTGGAFLGDTFNCLQLGLYSPPGTSFGVVLGNSARTFFGMDYLGKVGSLTNIYGDHRQSWRNLLDDGYGRVGIGTASPERTLEVVADSGVPYFPAVRISSKTQGAGAAAGIEFHASHTATSQQEPSIIYNDDTVGLDLYRKRLVISSFANSAASSGSRGVAVSLQGASEGA